MSGLVGVLSAGIGSAFTGSLTIRGYTLSETQIAIGGSIAATGLEEFTSFGDYVSPEALYITLMNEKF